MRIITTFQLNGFTHYLQAKGYSLKSRKNAIKEYLQFRTWLANQNIEVEQTSYNDVMAYIQYLQTRNLTQITIQRYINQIKIIFNYWVDTKLVENNPIQNFNIKGVKRQTLYNVLSFEDLEKLYKEFSLETDQTKKYPPRMAYEQTLCLKRDKIILGLLIYQGLNANELNTLHLKDLDLQQGTITIEGNRRSNTRLLKLESHQVISMYDYINVTRKELLTQKHKRANEYKKELQQEIPNLFISHDTGLEIINLLYKLNKQLKKQNPKLVGLKHIRASVIVHWLNTYNKRKVQYMLGHRYIGSTDSYETSNINDLQEDFNTFFPNLD